MAEGRRTTMPAKMMSEMPLPTPFSEICSPIHMRRAVPADRVSMVRSRKLQPGSGTMATPEGLREGVAVDAGGRAADAHPVGDQEPGPEQDAPLELLDLEDVLEALQTLDHARAASASPSSSTRPPLASILARAEPLTAWSFT